MSISPHLLVRRILQSSRRGTAAIEMAMLLLPFAMVLVGVFEVGIHVGRYAILQDAVKTASRLITTGQITSSDKVKFLNSISQNTYGIIDANTLSVFVNAYDSFSAIPVAFQTAFNSSGNASNQSFQTGTGNQVVVVRVSYWYSFETPLVSSLFSSSSSSSSIFTTTLVFRNEPF